MTSRSNSRETRNPRDFNDPRNRPQERSEWASRSERNRTDRPGRPDWAVRSEPRSQRERGDRPEGDRPRPPRGAGLLAELRELDRELLRMIVRRSRMLTRLPGGGAADHERELRTAWEAGAAAVSRDPRLIRQLFALLQEVEVAPANMEQPSAFNLAPSRKPVNVDLPAPSSDRLPRLNMVLAAASGCICTLKDVVLNAPVLECLKALNQVGARLRWEEDGRILCQEAAPITGYNKPILDKVVHVGGDAFNLYIILFQMVTRPARLKIIGESELKFVDLAPLRHFLPLLGARLTSVVPGQEGLPARLESSAMLPAEITVPAELPADAVEALVLSMPGWEREATLHLGDHPEGRAIVARVLPFLRAARLNAELTESGDDVTLRIVPGKAVLSETASSGINLLAAANLLAMPAFVGGTVRLHGPWNMLNEDSRRQVLDLFAGMGMNAGSTSDSVTVSLALPEATEEDAVPALSPLTDLSALPSTLFPLGLVLALIPAVRNKGGVMPSLPSGTDMTLVDSFMGQLGLLRDGNTLSTVEPSAAPWASPSVSWALALSLAAFLRPNIKLSNPGVVLSRLPHYWNLYNTLPSPTLTRKPAEEQSGTAPARPARRRVFASHTPESEMPDEIVYPDED